MRTPKVVVVGEDPVRRATLVCTLRAEGLRTSELSGMGGVHLQCPEADADLVILLCSSDECLPSLDALGRHPGPSARRPLILVTSAGSEALAVAALRAGVTDYLKEPCPPGELIAAIRRCLACGLGAPGAGAVEAAIRPVAPRRMIGSSRVMEELQATVRRVGPTDSSVLITGETGTGKELLAEFIHETSGRSGQPFVGLNCAAIPDTLLESELFGHEKGAFTSAAAARQGRFRQAHRGTIFFDEIGDMSALAQAKILRAIETREICPVGGARPSNVDVRLIAATSQDLEQMIALGRFRKDLYFRVNVFRFHIPPLRERPDDIPPLLDHFLRHFSSSLGRDVAAFSDDALECLRAFDWPGNVRQLKSCVEIAVINSASGCITLADLPSAVREAGPPVAATQGAERDRLLSALRATNWNKSRAAQALRWSRMTLYRKLKKYSLDRPDAAPDGSPRTTHDL